MADLDTLLTDRSLSKARMENARAGAGLRIATIGTSLVGLGVFASVAGKQFGRGARDWMAWAHFYSRGAIAHPVWYDETVYAGWEPSSQAGVSRNFQGLNFGVPGQTSPQVRARVEFVLANYADLFDAIVIDAGTNDMSNAATAKEDVQTDREWMAARFAAAGKLVLLTPVLGRGVGAWAAGSAARKKAHWVSQRTIAFCRGKRNILFWNWNEAFVNGLSANGEPYAGFSNDGTHFSMPGGEAVGLHLWNFLKSLGLPAGQPRVWAADDVYDVTDNPLGNLMTNGLLLGAGAAASGTGLSGTIATGLAAALVTGTGSMALSIEPRADGRGNNQVIAITPGGGANDESFYIQQNDKAHNAAGLWMTAGCELEVNAADTISSVSLALWDSTPQFKSHDLHRLEAEQATVVWPARNRAGRLQVPPLQMAAGGANFRWRLTITLRGAPTVNPVIKIGCLEARRIDDPRPAYPLKAA